MIAHGAGELRRLTMEPAMLALSTAEGMRVRGTWRVPPLADVVASSMALQ